MVDSNELESVLANIKDSSEKYEQEISNLYNEIETFSSWKGYVRDNFLNLINADNLAAKVIISEMSSISDIIKLIYDSYKEIGNKIEFNISKFDTTNTRASRVVTNLEKLVGKYDGLDTSFCNGSIRSAINSSKRDVKSVSKKMDTSKNKIREITTKIRENEENIASAISKVEIKNVNVTEAMEYVTPKVVGSDGDYLLNTNDMESLMENIQTSKTNLEEIISNLNGYYGTVIDSYSTRNSESLNSLFTKIMDEMTKLEEIHGNYIIGIGKYVNDIIEVNSRDFMEGVEIKNG